MVTNDGRMDAGAITVKADEPHLPGFWKREDLDEVPSGRLHTVAAGLAELMWRIDGIGNHGGEGYARYAWSDEEAWLRVWFASTMQSRGFTVEVDAAGNQWAWLGEPSVEHPGVTFGSHLDSVPGGGAFDGPLGTLSAIVAYDTLQAEGWRPPCPIGIVNFHDEEGARFAIACFGSRVLTGVLPGANAMARADADGVTVEQALTTFDAKLVEVAAAAMDARNVDGDSSAPAAGGSPAAPARALAGCASSQIDQAIAASHAPAGQCADEAYLRRSAAHIELHIEQGCAQRGLKAPVAVADCIWPHGRWRITFTGEPNHAGATPIDRRHDPMLAYAEFVLRARQEAERADQARATVGRVEVDPNGVNVIASHVTCWLDCRAREANTVLGIVDNLTDWLQDQDFEGVTVRVSRESWTEATVFSDELRDQLVVSASETVNAELPAGASADNAPVIGTAAGHDAGILAETGHAAGMLFVRNETGASHTPAEYATLADCAMGVLAYAQAVRDCAVRVAQGWRPVK